MTLNDQKSDALDQWQERLVANFDEVTFRKLELPHQPVTFGLEHGLNAAECERLSSAIHASVQRKVFAPRHYLCWVVYAAEFGYLYSGDEYWHTFQEQTPNWHSRRRPFIKACFLKFAEQYNGAIPQGAWAHHRSIICWPITHSILPKDLQRQLAQVLFRIRHNVVIGDAESPRQLGQLIAARIGDATSRFRQLASEPDLVGQIAAALLLEDKASNLIEPRTLSRIVADLNVEEQARSWLQDAKHHLSRRARVSGLRRETIAPRKSDPDTARAPRPLIRPTLSLRPLQEERWRLVIDVPSMMPLIRTYEDFQTVIARASFRVGRTNRTFQARALLHGGQSFAQTAWPSDGESLLSFDPSHPDLDALLQHACTLDGGPWLFRIGVDGVGRENRSRRVSTSGEYIAVGSPAQIASVGLGRTIDVTCDGVTALRFTATSLDDLSEALTALGFQPARKVIARPAGLVPARWDDEGVAEWLSTDSPVVSLSANFAIDQYDIQLDIGGRMLALTVQPEWSTAQTLVQLPLLPAGVYHLFVTAQPNDPAYRDEAGEMEIVIRDPTPESESSRGRTALLITLEPDDATLDDVFDGTLKIQGIGPPSREVRPTIRLLSKSSAAPLFVSELQTIRLPMLADDWARRINQLAGNYAVFSSAYHKADTCELTFDAGDIGIHKYSFDRPFAALRWGLTTLRDRPSITLYDDIDNPESIEIVRFEFSTPLKPRPVKDSELKRASQGSAAPGLYLARSDSHSAATIVPMQSIEELRGVRHRFHRPERSAESVGVFLDCIDIWGNVDTTGNLFGRHAWRLVLKALIQQLTGLVSGTHWYKADLAFGRNPQIEKLSRCIPFKDYGKGWPAPLTAVIDDICSLTIDEKILCMSDITASTIEICRFALQLTSDPTDIRSVFGNHFEGLLRDVMRRSEVVRAARFLVLTTAHRRQVPDDGERTIYGGWKWN